MSIDGEWETESTDVQFRLCDDGYWEARVVGTTIVHTSRSESMAIGFALREYADLMIQHATPTVEDYERTSK